MNLYEKLFDEKAIDEFISKAVQKQEEKVAQKTRETLEYYKNIHSFIRVSSMKVN